MIVYNTYRNQDGNSNRQWMARIQPRYILNGKLSLHRVAGPAIERTDGHKEWWFEGNLRVWQDGRTFDPFLRHPKILCFPGYEP